jgi:hypothetical protein
MFWLSTTGAPAAVVSFFIAWFLFSQVGSQHRSRYQQLGVGRCVYSPAAQQRREASLRECGAMSTRHRLDVDPQWGKTNHPRKPIIREID